MPPRQASGECFPWAYANARGGQLVHATVKHPINGRRYPHAWVERGGRVYDWQSSVGLGPGPKGWSREAFYTAYRPTKIARYAAADLPKRRWLKTGPVRALGDFGPQTNRLRAIWDGITGFREAIDQKNCRNAAALLRLTEAEIARGPSPGKRALDYLADERERFLRKCRIR